jgi:hypothetical protein
MRTFQEENLKAEIVQAILDLFVLSEIFEIDLPKEINIKINEMAKRQSSGG